MAGGRKSKLRNLSARNAYGSTFLGQTDPSASTSRTSSSRDNVPESQIPSAAPYVPPQIYDPAAYYPQQAAHMMTLLHTIPSSRLSMMSLHSSLAMMSLHSRRLLQLLRLLHLLRLLQLKFIQI